MKIQEFLTSGNWIKDTLATRNPTQKEKDLEKNRSAKTNTPIKQLGPVPVSPMDADANKWCLVGAAMVCYPEDWVFAITKIANRVGHKYTGGTAIWNNARETKFENVIEIVKELDL